MNSKKLITLLVLTTLLLSLLPMTTVSAAITVGQLWEHDDVGGTTKYTGSYKDKVAATGTGVTAGSTIEVYWDAVQAWSSSEGKGLMNTTKAESSGNYEIWFKVPEVPGGNHYVWVRDATTGNTDVYPFFKVKPDGDISADSGLPGYKPTIDAYGFAEDDDVAVVMCVAGLDGTDQGATQVVAATTIGELTYEFTLAHKPLEPGGTVAITDSVETFTDNGDGTLTGSAGGSGTIDYISGDVEVTFNAMVASNPITAAYEYYADVADTVYVFTASMEASSMGSITRRVTIPNLDDMNYNPYIMYVFNGTGANVQLDFTVGAVITVDIDEGPSGTVVEIRGEGFDGETTVTPGIDTINAGDVYISGTGVTDTDCTIIDVGTGIDVESDGEFKIEVVIPVPIDDFEDYDTITVNTGDETAAVSADFQVNGVAEITVDPSFGVQGSTVKIEGWNFTQISDEEVSVELWIDGYDPLDPGDRIVDIKEFKTNSDGHFEGTFTVPARASDPYDIRAIQTDYLIDTDDNFRIGMMIVISSPESAPTGKEVTLTGTGFTGSGKWNATLGDLAIFEDENVDSQGNLAEGTEVPTFYVPDIEPGVYTITVLDIDDEIEVEIDFTVTDRSTLTLDPIVGPQDYNISISGKYFLQVDGESLDFVIFNETEDWDMDVYVGPKTSTTRVELDEDGNFTGWWNFNKESLELDLGNYWINVTDGQEITFAQIGFEVVSKTVGIDPRKATFRIGDTVGFNVESSFAQDDSYIKIWDPDGDLYWTTDKFDTGDWQKVGTIQIVPFYKQTAGGNPMILLDDAPLGTWEWTWYNSDDDEIDSGAFNVEAAAADVLSEQVEDLNTAMADLTSDIATVSDAVAGVKSDVNSAIAAANAAVEAANAAVDAVNSVAGTASQAAEAAQNAAEAAENAQNAASGLTTLVYGAIGASLVAALAAIVSLMQISRRIAG